MGWRRTSIFWKVLLGFAVSVVALAIMVTRILSNLDTPAESPFRVVRNAEKTYAGLFPEVGYASNLTVLGPGGPPCTSVHACLLDNVLACPEGTGAGWCPKGRYRYNVQSSSRRPPYKDFWLTATPIEWDPKLKSYCMSSDGRVTLGDTQPLKKPYTLTECLALPVDPAHAN